MLLETKMILGPLILRIRIRIAKISIAMLTMYMPILACNYIHFAKRFPAKKNSNTYNM